MGQDSLDELIEKLIDCTGAYWDGYYHHESVYIAVRKDMKDVLHAYQQECNQQQQEERDG